MAKPVSMDKLLEPKGKERGMKLGQDAMTCPPEDVSNIVHMAREIAFWEKINLHDLQQVKDRMEKYFNHVESYGCRPTVAGIAGALKISRGALWAIANDKPLGSDGYKSALPREVTDFIKEIYKSLEIAMEEYAITGKINPVSGIFMLKNHFGYTDKVETVITPNVKRDDEYTAEDIRKRYAIESEMTTDDSDQSN